MSKQKPEEDQRSVDLRRLSEATEGRFPGIHDLERTYELLEQRTAAPRRVAHSALRGERVYVANSAD